MGEDGSSEMTENEGKLGNRNQGRKVFLNRTVVNWQMLLRGQIKGGH